MVFACQLAAVVAATFVEAPGRASTRSHARSSSPFLIIDQMKSAATELKGAAAEAVVKQKVAEKLAKAQEKYDVPDKYMNVMSGFFTSYMTEVYKAGMDMDQYEGTLTTLFQKVAHVLQPQLRRTVSSRIRADCHAMPCP
jgi:hypothetical protein